MLEQTVPATGLGREAVLALSERRAEPAWMRERRLEAWGLYEAMPLPDPNADAWRRTDISGLQLDEVRPILDGQTRGGGEAWPRWVQEALAGAGERRGGMLVQRDGRTVHHAVDEAVRRQGVLFLDTHAALSQVPDLVREHFMAVVRPDELKFRALHAALWNGGTFLYVPPRVEVTLPLLSATWIDTSGAGLFPHTLVVADEGSKVTLIDLFGSDPMARQTVVSNATELILRDGAQVRYVAFQDWGPDVWEFGIIRAHLARDATLHSLVVAFGGSLVKTDIESLLRGSGSRSEMLGLYFGDETQHFDFRTLQEHFAPHTQSDLLYKGAVKDRARSVFAGLIRVHQGAQKTNAFQSNRNLILNAGAKAVSDPKLEIMANDLRCTHGSATSRLNDEHLFYLMSRGLRRQQAVQMVVDGFFAEVLDRVSLADLRGQMQQEIARKLEEM